MTTMHPSTATLATAQESYRRCLNEAAATPPTAAMRERLEAHRQAFLEALATSGLIAH